jgi:hypothetical protein
MERNFEAAQKAWHPSTDDISASEAYTNKVYNVAYNRAYTARYGKSSYAKAYKEGYKAAKQEHLGTRQSLETEISRTF